ncbi:hypothetical protein [Aureimonas ureilytica]|uniref:hypothetical protein n=1 Tax=Aureimonas ureilytica TaxID=401562 RepID=UPI0003659E86|nr:hypothetical protein [Aureimonas ureilytica]
MSNIAFEDLDEKKDLPRKRLRERLTAGTFSAEWTLADWLVGTASVTLAVASASFFCWSFAVSLQSPDYFQQAALANMPPKLDQIQTGSIDTSNAMPAPEIVRLREPTPEDYQIVMVFRNEALLATRDELVRVKVGSVVPGLGSIRTIDAEAGSPTVVAENATLRGVANTNAKP